MKVNILPMAVLTRLFTPGMLSRPTRSGIINVSSSSVLVPFAGCSHYAATKNFNDVFSRALSREINHKVDVLTAEPFFVSTAMTKNIEKTDYVKPSATA